MATSPETPADTTAAATPSRVVKWLGSFALGGALLAIVISLLSLTLARFDIIDKLTGFIGFMMMFNPARALAVVAAVALAIAVVRKTGPKWQAIGGLVLSLGLLLVFYTQVIIPGGNAPPLHDITTDVDSPPAFLVLELREDNLIPFQNIDEWRAAHRDGYPEIAPVIINKSPDLVMADVRALMEDRGWDIANYDAQSGHMEATAYAGFLRFRDDVVVEATPIQDGSTRVDMRSVSRVGLSDLGYNAKRIKAFLADLQGA